MMEGVDVQDTGTVLVGGDVCPIGRNESLFAAGDMEGIAGDLLPLLQQADCTVVNLECPLADDDSPIVKAGPALRAPVHSAAVLKKLGVDLVGLANNHIMDHGPQGLASTMNACVEAGLVTFGAGADLTAAGRMEIRTIGALRVGFLAMAEKEWSIAGRTMAGASLQDPVAFVRTVRQRRQDFDLLVVLLHGGPEHYPFPTPRLQQLSRFLVEEGASLVVSQHSHCAGTWEFYGDGCIVYGQGNLLFDYGRPPESEWHTGFLVEMSVKSGSRPCFRFLAYTQSGRHDGIRLMPEPEAEAFLAVLEQRSKDIESIEFVDQKWEEFVQNRRKYYLRVLRGYRRWLTAIDRRIPLAKLIYKPGHLNTLLTMLSCDSHRDGLEASILEELK
jgi:hypothetical protein